MAKSLTLCLLLGLLCLPAMAQESSPREMNITEGDQTFTMKRYVFCLYLSGPDRTSHSDEEVSAIQSAHLAHLGTLEESHHLMIAGPFDDDTEKRGLLIFDLETVQEAEEALEADPAVKAGRLRYECHAWWGGKGSELK